MAEWSYAVGDPATVKLYSHKLFAQAVQSCIAWRLAAMGVTKDSPDNICQLMTDTQKTEGDTIKYDLLTKIQGAGVIGDNLMAGNEDVPRTVQDSMLINQLRNSVLVAGQMSQQRVPFSMRDNGKRLLSDWCAERWDVSLLNQLAGNNSGTLAQDLRYSGMNATVLPDAQHAVFASPANAESSTVGLTGSTPLVLGNSFGLAMIDSIVAKAHTFATPIKSIRMKGLEVVGCLFLHPLQVRSLRTNFTTGQWGDIQRAAMQGGQITGNPIFTGAMGMYDKVIIHEDNRVPYGSEAQSVDAQGFIKYNSLGIANVARGVFCGAQAACMAFGRAYGADAKMRWFEELLDAGNQLRVTAGMIFGIKKTRFNSADYATITASSYEADV